MNEIMHASLSVWGRWVARQWHGGLGYPPVSAGFGDYRPASVAYKSSPPVGVFTGMGNEDMKVLSDAVDQLCLEDKRICREYYVVTGAPADIAKRLSVCRRTLYLKLGRIHDRLADVLCVESGAGGKVERW